MPLGVDQGVTPSAYYVVEMATCLHMTLFYASCLCLLLWLLTTHSLACKNYDIRMHN